MKKRFLVICILLLGLIAFLVFYKNEPVKHTAKSKKTTVSVETTEFNYVDLEYKKRYLGTLFPIRKFEVKSDISGTVSAINYDIGDSVKSGSIIATLDDTLFRLELEQTRGKLTIGEANIQQRKLSIIQETNEVERMKALRARKVVSESDLEKSINKLAEEKLKLTIDQANLEAQQNLVAMAEYKVSKTKILGNWENLSPDENLLIAERFVEVGENINQNTSIAEVLDINQVIAEIFVAEQDYPLLKKGERVEVSVDSFPAERFEGSIHKIAPFINEKSRQAKVKVLINNEGMKLRPGMFARCKISLRQREAVPMLPKKCIVRRDNVEGIFVLNPQTNKVRFEEVLLGQYYRGQVEITNAQDFKDKEIVSSALYILKDGVTVIHKSSQQ